MRFKFKPIYMLGITAAIILLVSDFLLFFNKGSPSRLFYPMFIISLVVAGVQFLLDFLKELKRQKRLEEKFLDFTRNMGSAVKSGISIPASIIQAAGKDYAELDPYVKKMANQIRLGIPIHRAMVTFAEDTKNIIIKRAISIVIEAEASGGDISQVLDSVTGSLVAMKKLKEEQKSGSYGQIVQGYLVYFIFIAIMLVLQLKLFPKLTQLGKAGGGSSMGGIGGLGGGVGTAVTVNLDKIFFILLLIQGGFAGLMIGFFSEGQFKRGIIHAIALVVAAALIVTTVKGGI